MHARFWKTGSCLSVEDISVWSTAVNATSTNERTFGRQWMLNGVSFWEAHLTGTGSFSPPEHVLQIICRFFNRHLADKCGTRYLQTVLNQQLTNHIRDHLPKLRARFEKQMQAMERDVKDSQNYDPDDSASKAKAFLTIVHQFSGEVERSIEGTGTSSTDDVSTSELSGGARINRLFHERFPFEMVKIQWDEKELRREIAFAIRNIHGVRLGLFTPDKAFEAIVKRQIEKMRDPCKKCVDLVVTELTTTVSALTEKVSRYPGLRQEIEHMVVRQLSSHQQRVKDHLCQIIDCELSYMNTNHEDFVGFNSDDATGSAGPPGGAGAGTAVQNGSTPQGRHRLGNQVIRKGWLSVHNESFMRSRSREYWFVLSTEHLSWFRDETEKDRKYMMQLEGLKFREADSGIISKRPTIQIFHPDGRNVYRDHKTLELSCVAQDDIEDWKAALASRAGVFPEKAAEEKEEASPYIITAPVFLF